MADDFTEIENKEFSQEEIADALSDYERISYMSKSRVSLTPHLTEKVVRGLKAGLSLPDAARYASITPNTIYQWLKMGEKKPDSIYGDFVREVDKAMGELAYNLSSRLMDLSSESWEGTLKILERRFPKTWGNKDKTRIEADVKAHVVVEYVNDWKKKIVDEVHTDAENKSVRSDK
jgi:hypothetical protein